MTTLLLLCAACGDAAPEVDGEDAAAWTAKLNDESKRADAQQRLQEAGKEAVPLLVELVEGEAERPRLIALDVLARIGEDAAEAVPALTNALRADDPGTRGLAALALGRIGKKDHAALIQLDRMLDSEPEARVRVMAALAVWGMTGDGATAQSILSRELTTGSPSVSLMVAEMLSELGTDATDLLLLCLVHYDPRIRLAGINGLRGIGADSKDVRTALAEAMTDTDKNVAMAAAKTLQALAKKSD